jgi:mannose-6-phosphate isomerase-like protein (cupin superfamily)
MGQEMELVRLGELERDTPVGHWGVGSRFVEQAGERLTVQLCEMATEGGAEPHAHKAQDQMFVVLDGALTVRGDGDGVIVVRGGEALRIPAGAVHATANRGGVPTSYLVLTYPAAR